MKYIIFIFTIAVLASCWANTEKTNTWTVNTWTTNTSSLNSELNSELKTMTASWTEDWKITKLNADYESPAWKVKMDFSYKLDDSGNITFIDVESSANHNWFDKKVEEELLWKTLKDAEKLYISGSSLASEAFTKAIKNS